MTVKYAHVLFKSIERSEYSYIGLADFFFLEKVLEFVHAQSVLIFRGLTYDFFLSSVHFYC